jgi:hypothetical protein
MFANSLERNGFVMNPYDPCVANKIVDGKVLAICFHVDDCKISHRFTIVVNDTIAWLRDEYDVICEDGIGAMKVHRGKVHNYLSMVLDYSHWGEVHLSIPKQCQAKIGNGFVGVKKKSLCKSHEECEKLPKEHCEYFHCIVAKLLFVQKRVWADIGPSIAFLTKRMKAPDLEDWSKLAHLIDYLKPD